MATQLKSIGAMIAPATYSALLHAAGRLSMERGRPVSIASIIIEALELWLDRERAR
jgi:hypothetical protein